MHISITKMTVGSNSIRTMAASTAYVSTTNHEKCPLNRLPSSFDFFLCSFSFTSVTFLITFFLRYGITISQYCHFSFIALVCHKFFETWKLKQYLMKKFNSSTKITMGYDISNRSYSKPIVHFKFPQVNNDVQLHSSQKKIALALHFIL